jgi:hypothetical protein
LPNTELEAWRNDHSSYGPDVTSVPAIIDCQGRSTLALRWPPSPLVLTHVGDRHSTVNVTLRTSEVHPVFGDNGPGPRAPIRIQVHPNLQTLRFATSFPSKILEIVPDSVNHHPIGIVDLSCRRLVLKSIAAVASPRCDITSLCLDDASIHGEYLDVDLLVVGGHSAATGNISARSTLFGRSALNVDGSVRLGYVTTDNPYGTIFISGSATIAGIRRRGLSVIANDDLTVDQSREETRQPLVHVRLQSRSGSIVLRGVTISESVMRAAASLQLSKHAWVIESESWADVLNVSQDSVIHLRRGTSRFNRISSGEGEITGIPAYQLTQEHVSALEHAIRFSPWLAPRSRVLVLARRTFQRFAKWLHTARFADSAPNDAMTASRYEDNMLPGLPDRSREALWSRLRRLVEEGHASGRTQAEVRYAWMRARLRASRISTVEGILLRSYGLVGFGERIGRPIVWHVCLSSLAAIPVSGVSTPRVILGSQAPQYWSTVVKLLASPLRFFRVDINIDAGGSFINESLIVAVQSLGVVLIIFAIIAMRRITKAE